MANNFVIVDSLNATTNFDFSPPGQAVLVGRATSSSSASAVIPLFGQVVLVGRATSSSSASAVIPLLGQTVLVGRATSSSSASAVTATVPLEVLVGRATSSSSASAVTSLLHYAYPIGRVASSSSASSVTPYLFVPFPIGRATSSSSTSALTSLLGLMVPVGAAASNSSTSALTSLLGLMVPVGAVASNSSTSAFTSLLGLMVPVGRATDISSTSSVTFNFFYKYILEVEQDIEAAGYFHRLRITQEIAQDYSYSLDITQDIIRAVFTYELQIEQGIEATGTNILEIAQNVIEVLNADGTVNNDPPDPDFPLGGYTGTVFTPEDTNGNWEVSASIGGIDISAVLTGSMSVNKEENQAQTASFSILDTDLSDAQVNTWNQQTVTIIFVNKDNGNQYPLFNGSIVGYTYDSSTLIFNFTATDNLQAVVQELYSTDTLYPPDGYAFKKLSTPVGANGWLWLQEAVATIPMSYGLNEEGLFTYYSWDSPATGGLQFTEANIIEQTLDVTLQDTKAIINFIEIVLTEQGKSVAMSYATDERFLQTNTRIHKATVYCRESLDSYGVKRETSEVTLTANHTNSLEIWTRKNDAGYLSASIMASLVLGAKEDGLDDQDVCPVSSIPDGAKAYTDKVRNFYKTSGATSSEVPYDEVAVPEVCPNDTGPAVADPGSTTGGAIAVIDADDLALCNNHEQVLDTLDELLLEATKKIKETHRQTSVSLSASILPQITWGSGAVVDTLSIQATGRVSSVTHSLDFNSGNITTDVTIKVPHGGKFVKPGPVVITPEDYTCPVGGGFNEVAYGETKEVDFQTVLVTLPTTNIAIGKY